MSLHNDFNNEYFGLIKSKNLKEYRPLCMVGEIVIYKHKARREWYVSEHYSGHAEKYGSSDIPGYSALVFDMQLVKISTNR